MLCDYILIIDYLLKYSEPVVKPIQWVKATSFFKPNLQNAGVVIRSKPFVYRRNTFVQIKIEILNKWQCVCVQVFPTGSFSSSGDEYVDFAVPKCSQCSTCWSTAICALRVLLVPVAVAAARVWGVWSWVYSEFCWFAVSLCQSVLCKSMQSSLFLRHTAKGRDMQLFCFLFVPSFDEHLKD